MNNTQRLASVILAVGSLVTAVALARAALRRPRQMPASVSVYALPPIDTATMERARQRAG